MWLIIPDISLDFITFIGQKTETVAVVKEAFRTNVSEGGSKHNPGRPVYGYRFEFKDTNGVKQQGVSYASGQSHENGSNVEIEYPAARPEKARIKGMRRGAVGTAALLVLIFPAVGLAFIIKGIRDGIHAFPLLKNGLQVSGMLISKTATNTRVNNATVYKLTFQFKVNGALYTSVAKTHLTSKLEDEQEEPILYNPDDPNISVLLDSLPGAIDVREDGELVCKKALSGLAASLLPLLTIGGNIAYALNRFLH